MIKIFSNLVCGRFRLFRKKYQRAKSKFLIHPNLLGMLVKNVEKSKIFIKTFFKTQKYKNTVIMEIIKTLSKCLISLVICVVVARFAGYFWLM